MRRTWVVLNITSLFIMAGCSTESGVGVGPAAKRGIERISSVAMGDYFNIYLLSDRTLRGFGQGGWGLLGNDTSVAQELVGGTAATAWKMNANSSIPKIPGGRADEIVAGHQFTLVRVGGNVYSFGLGFSESHASNLYISVYGGSIDPSGSRILGNLGYDSNFYAVGTTTTTLTNVAPLAARSPINLGFSAVALAAGAAHACAISTLGSVRCWGDNTSKQLGIASPVLTVGFDADRVGCQPGSAAQNNGVSCRTMAQADMVPLGDANLLGNLVSATSINAAGLNTCAASATRVVCWGADNTILLNGLASLPAGTVRTTSAVAPGVTFLRWNAPSGLTVQKVSVGYNSLGGHVLVLLSNGQVYYWGSTHGVGATTALTPPTLLNVGQSVRDIATGKGSLLSCIATQDGKVSCWGLDQSFSGSFGNGLSGIKWFEERQPALLGATFDATKVFVGPDEACAIDSQSHAKCWGFNLTGQFGLGDVENRNEAAELGDNLPYIGSL